MQNNSSEKSQGDRQSAQEKSQPCHYCDGQGYIVIRDCSGDIQREENCSFCNGTGTDMDDNQI